jgi:DNA polymerase III delta subunit
MIIKYQISQKLKLNPKTRIFLISYQDDEIYRQINQELREHYQCLLQTNIVLQQTAQWQELELATRHYQLFAEPQTYEIEIQTAALKAKKLPQITPLETDIFIFKTKDFKAALLQQLQAMPNTLWIQAYQANLSEFWRYFKQQVSNFKFEPDVEAWFLHQEQMNFSLCKQLAEKIHLSFESNRLIQINDLQNLLGYAATELNWNPLVQAWMRRNHSECIHILRNSVYKDSDLILLIWILNRQAQVLYALKQAIQDPKQIFSQFKLWPKQQQECTQFIQYFSGRYLEQALTDLQSIDQQLKSGQANLALINLERFFLMDA